MDDLMNYLWVFLAMLGAKIIFAIYKDSKEMGYNPIPKVEWRGGAFPAGPVVYFLFGCAIGNYQNIYLCLGVLALIIVILKCDFFVREE